MNKYLSAPLQPLFGDERRPPLERALVFVARGELDHEMCRLGPLQNLIVPVPVVGLVLIEG